MSSVRGVNTRFWSDNFIREHLNPLDRYLFLYFLTNEKTNIGGVYELPMSTISSETGLEKEMLSKMLKRLSGKIDYFDGWVIIRNFTKYQNTKSDSVQKGIERVFSEIPKRIRDYIEKDTSSLYHPPIIPTQPEVLNYTILNLTKPTDTSNRLDFNQFWNIYPKKVERKTAELKWSKLPYEVQLAIIADIPRRILGRQWKAGYIPNPTTYLNGERWNDVIEVETIQNNHTIIE